MGTCIGGVKLSRIAYFEGAVLSLADKGHLIFTGDTTRPKALSKEWYAEMSRLAAHCKEVTKILDVSDPIECLHWHAINGKSMPAGRCADVADALDALRDGIKRLDDQELAMWHIERPECMTLEYHLDAYVKELRGCHESKRSFRYSV
jgi:hypothetical protein